MNVKLDLPWSGLSSDLETLCGSSRSSTWSYHWVVAEPTPRHVLRTQPSLTKDPWWMHFPGEGTHLTPGWILVGNLGAKVTPFISTSHLSLRPALVGPGCLSSSLRLSFLGGNVPAFFYHFFSFCFPLPLLVCSLLLGVVGSRKRRELSLVGSLECLIPGLGLHHLQQATPGSVLDTHLVC